MPHHIIVKTLVLLGNILFIINACTTSTPRHPNYQDRIDALEEVVEELKVEKDYNSNKIPPNGIQ